jgi:hydroxypyruvate isomerase
LVRLAASLTMLFTERPFLERFAAARRCGVRAVEFMFPYGEDRAALESALQRSGLELVLFNLPAGDWAAGERGIAADPERVAEFRDGVRQAREWARALGCRRLNCLPGRGNPRFAPEEQWRTLVDNVRYAAEELDRDGVLLLVEAVNPVDVPGFVVPRADAAVRLLDAAGLAGAHLQYDVYHEQRAAGNVSETFARLQGRIAHVQIADSPGRHQPGTGELDYRYVLGRLDALGYAGFVSMEYLPQPDTESSLAWVQALGFRLG